MSYYNNNQQQNQKRHDQSQNSSADFLTKKYLGNDRNVINLPQNTGCGKSTQVPQYLIEGKSKDQVNIICTQPRRIAAITLSQRVSKEQNEDKYGEKIGYQIKTDSCKSKKTQILFVTTGMFLTNLVHRKQELLNKYTHIIIDEVHERDLDSDFSMIALKHYLAFNNNVKLILMSATINHETFAKYFCDEEIQKLKSEIISSYNKQQDIIKNPKYTDDLEVFMDKYVRVSTKDLQHYYWHKSQTYRLRSDLKQDIKQIQKDEKDNWSKYKINEAEQKEQTKQNQLQKASQSWGQEGEDSLWHTDGQVIKKEENVSQINDEKNQQQKSNKDNQMCIENENQANVNQNQDNDDDNDNQILSLFAAENEEEKEDEEQNAKKDNCIILKPEKTYNVDVVYLNSLLHQGSAYYQDLFDDVDEISRSNCQELSNESWDNQQEASVFEGTYETCLNIVRGILKRNMSFMLPDFPKNKLGSILIFLPGIREIQKMSSLIKERLSLFSSQLLIIELHGSLASSQHNQQLMQEFKNQTKIIIATNIAESSITIPDCFYVIEIKNFVMYLKKLSNNHSRRQHNLFIIIFRLIPEQFYKILQPFPTAEIQRCPLERLILRAKRLDERQETEQVREQLDIDQAKKYELNIQNLKLKIEEGAKKPTEEGEIQEQLDENQIKYDNFFLQHARMFRNPVVVLLRALDPPQPEDIGVTIRSLLQLGGLEEIQKTKPQQVELQLTKLGLFICDMPTDIRLSKFICLSHYFDCFNEAITISAILSHRHNFFQINSLELDFERKKQIDIQFMYDKGFQSDIMIRLRIFREWEYKFFKPYYEKRKQFLEEKLKDNGVTNMPQDIKNRQILFNFNKFHQNFEEELRWCEDHLVDSNDMKEILASKFDLEKRHNSKMNGIIVYEDKDIYDPQIAERIHVCFASCFLSFSMATDNYIFKNNLNLIEMMKNAGCEPKKTLYLELDKLFSNIQKIPDNEVEIIRENLQLSLQKYIERSKLSDQYDKLNCLDQAKSNQVHVDIQSINHIVFNYDNVPRNFVSFGLQEKENSKFSSNINFALPKNYPLILPIIGMIFGCQVRLNCDEFGKQYNNVEFDSIQIPLQYYIFDKDINLINSHRKQIKDYLTEAQFLSINENQKDGWKKQWQEIQNKLIQANRLKHIKEDKYWTVYLNDKGVQHQPRICQIFLGSRSVRQGRGMSEFGDLNSNRNQRNQIYGTSKHQFMQPLVKSSQSINNVQINSSENIVEIKQYYQEYIEWKKSVIFDLNLFFYRQTLEKAHLICEKCFQNHVITPVAAFQDNLLTYQDQSMESNHIYQLERQLRVLKINIMKDKIQFRENLDVEQFYQDHNLQEFFEKIKDNSQILYSKLTSKSNIPLLFTCSENTDHFIGIRDKDENIHPFYQECYIPNKRLISIIFPGLEIDKKQSFIFRQLNQQFKQRVAQIEKEELVNLGMKLQQKKDEVILCKVCLDENGLPFEFNSLENKKNHIKDKKGKHMKNFENFEKSINEPVFINSNDSTDPTIYDKNRNQRNNENGQQYQLLLQN
ncbi:P-loop containing nucleoside triphosphate hydrolase [Pseudocohnilembus persalinus]|uniref:p-loop containing nucleoside triphosphate hydrolase n=1 Tax=Pseudocohnilembus persalinus TaxID=266149 RepID=A0A0V0R1X2_PSEPJ|nr:P-loop containing nucleoside triphosphate hydrolase [Pseudocohnilembus persalinus]|eukprot:KRX08535.1 P-loop containing nucleoside triphosphate hydrolase [Pseudocohnilembus persalinus]